MAILKRQSWLASGRVFALALLVGLARCGAPLTHEGPAPAESVAPLGRVQNWAYWLQDVRPSAAGELVCDLLVTDPSRDGSAAGRWGEEDMRALSSDPRGGKKLLLAYLSVGEAEDYRGYWKPAWKASAPSWLGPENPEWKGNYPVRFWDPAWQELILGEGGPLAAALRQGFDGIYLDRIDVYEHWEEELGPAPARERMAAFVLKIAARARELAPGALVVLQNGGEVAVRPEVLSRIDALALEDTFFNGEEAQSAEHTRIVLEQARRVRRAGKPVFAVDYCREPAHVAAFARQARAEGLIPYAATRALDQPTRPLRSPR